MDWSFPGEHKVPSQGYYGKNIEGQPNNRKPSRFSSQRCQDLSHRGLLSATGARLDDGEGYYLAPGGDEGVVVRLG